MDRVELKIYAAGTPDTVRAIVNKWEFDDAMMGEQFISFNLTSEKTIPWSVGDYCVFRGEIYTLNYVPTVTQKARVGERQDAYTYESVKMESRSEELTRCIMLDITATNSEYVPALGTNYTGSSQFTLFCGETMIDANGNITSDASLAVKTLTPVCTLAAKMQANLDRMYGADTWTILVDTVTTHTNASGRVELVTHTEDKQLSFNNTTVAQALAEVHNTFDLDYCIQGRIIRIGFALNNLVSDDDAEVFAFGYGRGYPTPENQGKALFQIKRIADSQQQIVTRLRALGSTKNLPYRYYNKAYDLSQALFPTNLQLPDTFLPMTGSAEHKRPGDPDNKTAGNASRHDINPNLCSVLGDTNDAYIDKNNDAASCAEGIREACVKWDGSDGDLQEIYPTIEEVTYGELREAGVKDSDGQPFSPAIYLDDERIDELLAVGYLDGSDIVDDANVGNGILAEDSAVPPGVAYPAEIALRRLSFDYDEHPAWEYIGYDWGTYANRYAGGEVELLTIGDVFPGKYVMVPNAPGYNTVCFYSYVAAGGASVYVRLGFEIVVRQRSKENGQLETLGVFRSELTGVSSTDTNDLQLALPEIPDLRNAEDAQIRELDITTYSDVIVSLRPIMEVPRSDYHYNFDVYYRVDGTVVEGVYHDPEYIWRALDNNISNPNGSFHVFIKDMGFDITACFTNDTPLLAMKSGRCIGREFEIGENVQKVTYQGKKGYMLTLNRVKDSTLNTYFPSETDPIAAGDHFVLLNINMPDVYIKAAEARLLRAATDWLAENCTTKFTYQPSLDNIYVQRNLDKMRAAGREQDSIFWRLYAGLTFTFVAYFGEGESIVINLTINKVKITMGEGLIPKIELTLSDDVQQTTLQKVTTAVDKIYRGSLFSDGYGTAGAGSNADMIRSILNEEGEKLFLSKRANDTASGIIRFDEGITFGEFERAVVGGGVWKDESGNWHLETDYINARKKLQASEVDIQEAHHVGGSMLLSAANMSCLYVEDDDAGWKCYFLATDSDGNSIQNLWAIGDQAYVQTFNLNTQAGGGVGNHFLWRYVDGKGTVNVLPNGDSGLYHYIHLSGSDCAEGSDAPLRGDAIVQLGYRAQQGDISPATRQSAILISGAGSDAPCIDEYAGIDSYSLSGKLYSRIKPGDNILSGRMIVKDGSTGVGNFSDLPEEISHAVQVGTENILRNSGFDGEHESRDLAADTNVVGTMEFFSPRMEFWEGDGESIETPLSASGYGVRIATELFQSVELVKGERYVIGFGTNGDGQSFNVSCGAFSASFIADGGRKTFFFEASSSSVTFAIQKVSNGASIIYDLKLERGTVATDWSPSSKDTDPVADKFKELWYLQQAIKDGNTQILGGLILSSIINLGQWENGEMRKVTAGMSGVYNDDDDIAFWGGGDFESAIRAVSMFRNNPGYIPTESELNSIAKVVFTHGGRGILNDIVLRGYVYALGGVFRGKVYAEDGVFSGTIMARNGNFSGFLQKTALHINEDNRDEFMPEQSGGQRRIRFSEAGCFLIFDADWGAGSTAAGVNIEFPSCEYSSSGVSYGNLQEALSYIGNQVILIINDNTFGVRIDGRFSSSLTPTSQDIESSVLAMPQYPSTANHRVIVLECRNKVVNGTGYIYWYYQLSEI